MVFGDGGTQLVVVVWCTGISDQSMVVCDEASEGQPSRLKMGVLGLGFG